MQISAVYPNHRICRRRFCSCISGQASDWESPPEWSLSRRVHVQGEGPLESEAQQNYTTVSDELRERGIRRIGRVGRPRSCVLCKVVSTLEIEPALTRFPISSRFTNRAMAQSRCCNECWILTHSTPIEYRMSSYSSVTVTIFTRGGNKQRVISLLKHAQSIYLMKYACYVQ